MFVPCRVTGEVSDARSYNWHIKYKPVLFRVAAVCAVCLSVFSLLGMIGSVSGVAPSTSVYYLAVHSDKSSGIFIVVFILVTLMYAAYIALWSIFQMKVSGMVKHLLLLHILIM